MTAERKGMLHRVRIWWLCETLGRHSFCVPNGTFSGAGIATFLHDTHCSRCKETFGDLYNRGAIR